VSTLYFETDAGDGFREPGFSGERRLEPRITIGLLTDQSGFPLVVSAFEGNKAETKTMLPVIESFMTAYDLPDVTIVADAGMVSGGEPEGDRGSRAVVHPRHEDPAHPVCSRAVAARAPRRGHPGRAHLHPALARRAGRRPPRPGHLLPVPPLNSADSDGPVLPAALWRSGRLALCVCMFRDVILRSAGLLGCPRWPSREVQIRTLVQIFPGDGKHLLSAVFGPWVARIGKIVRPSFDRRSGRGWSACSPRGQA
jgi:hypothetical protein